MIRRSVVLSLYLAMLGFGVVTGLIFPLVVSPFVVWKEGYHGWFRLLSIVAGLLVGGVGIFLVRTLLMRKIAVVSEQLRGLSEGRGHLSENIDFTSRDELGLLVERFNLLLSRLHASMAGVSEVAQTLSSRSRSTKELAQSLLEGTESKTQLVVDTAISIDELETSFGTVGENLLELQASSNESRRAAQNQVEQIETVNRQIVQLLQQCQTNADGLEEATAATHNTTTHSQELTNSLTEAASSMTEMDQTLREVDRSLKETSAVSEKVATDAGVGKEAVWTTQKEMDRIRESFDTAAGVIRSFSEKAKEIAAITEVIDEVTDQTNLLALNASIIAAQAGEHGRGFAVVAGQIKKLADQTASSTQEIGKLIKDFHKQAGNAISTTGEMRDLIAKGVSLSQKAGNSLDRILESAGVSHEQIQHLENAVNEITRTSHYMSERVDSIAGRAQNISKANQDLEFSLRAVSRTVQETRNVAGVLSESSREQLASSKKIESHTDTVNRLVENTRTSVLTGEEETAKLVASIQQIQQLSQREKEVTLRLDEESTLLNDSYRTLESETGRFGEAGEGEGR